MAEDKKPKIDLKSRLQRMGGPAAATPPPPAAGIVRPSAPPPPAARSGPGLTPMPPPSVPPPSGMTRGMGMGGLTGGMASHTAALDPNNPLSAVAQPYKPQAAHPPVQAQPQRIEVDEQHVHTARSGARKQGLVIGLLFAVVLGGIGWVGGSASQQGTDRAKGVNDAHGLSTDLLKAKTQLDAMKQKVTDGGKMLVGDRKFPADLQQTLAGMTVDFAGDKLFGRRFAGVPADTTRDLFDFINRVQALNSKKDLIVSLLSKLQKPITEELARPMGQLPISMVVVVDKNTGDVGTMLASLVTPIAPDDKNGVPNELLFANPRGGGNAKLPRLTGDKIPKDGAAITVSPTSFDKLCPSPVKGQIAQLMTSMNSLIDDIQGQQGSTDPNIVQDSKPGLSESAGKLADQLSKVN